MLVLGINGSPRKKSNSGFLLSTFLEEAEKLGARTHVVDVNSQNILPCRELIVCEKKGFCPIDDDMKTEVYSLLREADVVVPATPIFFYNATAQLKALIDRSQTLWARKSRLNLSDPKSKIRRGFYLSVAATRGKQLFEGLDLTMKYFFDAVDARHDGGLTYRGVEHSGDMEKHPTMKDDIRDTVNTLVGPLAKRKKIVFGGHQDACRSQMAAAFTNYLAGDQIDAERGGSKPAQRIHPLVGAVMREKGIDMAFHQPRSLNPATKADRIIQFTGGSEDPTPTGNEEVWEIPPPSEEDPDTLRRVRDDIDQRVQSLLASID
ncbi:hypothetical protein D3OALGA1CA_3722 [Olavius algarvensis associated proteobacterium Delta 3]|nr:hypothetical protein D3OALGA1CA_3722 [Olavius algarvensis associated proteobacterium Delta 3]